RRSRFVGTPGSPGPGGTTPAVPAMEGRPIPKAVARPAPARFATACATPATGSGRGPRRGAGGVRGAGAAFAALPEPVGARDPRLSFPAGRGPAPGRSRVFRNGRAFPPWEVHGDRHPRRPRAV